MSVDYIFQLYAVFTLILVHVDQLRSDGTMMVTKESACASSMEAAMEMETTFSPNGIVRMSVLFKVMELELLCSAIDNCSLKNTKCR